MKKDNSIRLITRKKEKKIKDDGYGDDLMSWAARFIIANNGKAPAPAELAAFIKSRK